MWIVCPAYNSYVILFSLKSNKIKMPETILLGALRVKTFWILFKQNQSQTASQSIP